KCADVRNWHEATQTDVRSHVRDWGMSGLVMFTLSFVGPDPERTSPSATPAASVEMSPTPVGAGALAPCGAGDGSAVLGLERRSGLAAARPFGKLVNQGERFENGSVHGRCGRPGLHPRKTGRSTRAACRRDLGRMVEKRRC